MLCAFYWDESWPYVPAIKEMFRHGISLLPGAVSPDLSRGHPLFFHAIGAAWIHIFGQSNMSLHAFALCISLLFLVTIYESVSRLFNKRAAIISLLLVATHVSFFVQSSFVLLEMLVAFLSFLSIWLYVKEKYLLATLSLTALMLTKQSGAVAVFIIGMYAFVGLFAKDVPIKAKLTRLIPPAIACAAIALFFIIQKHKYGWYVLPLYTDTILTKWDDIWYRFTTGCVSATLCENTEYVLFYTLVVLSVFVIIKEKTKQSIALLCLLVPVIIGYYYCDGLRLQSLNYPTYTVASVVTIIVFIGFYFATLMAYSCKAYFDNLEQRRFLLLVGCFILAYMIFSSFVYFIPRYLLAAIVPALILVGIFADMLVRQSYSILFYPVLVIIAAVGYSSFRDSSGWNDNETGFYYGLKTQTAIVEYMERSNYYDKHIAASYLNATHLSNHDCGFLSSWYNFNNVGFDITDKTDIVIFDNIETDYRHDMIAKDTSFKLVYRIAIRNVWAEIYKRK
jgi:4-amino-4-deoxy-L-arabinose transferase-like glycosyltransferase